MSLEKLGLHIVEGYNGVLGRPTVVKLANVSVDYVAQVRDQVGPDTLIVVRWITSHQPLVDPRQDAQAWWYTYRDEMYAIQEVAGPEIAFEGYNEVPDELAELYATFEIQRLEFLHRVGLRAVVGNWSVGVPDLPTWETYQPVLDAMTARDLVGLHEYWVNYGDIGNPWHAGRWQLVPQLDGIPVVVTECGRDVVENRGRRGWKLSCGPDEFIEDLRRYHDEILAPDARVIGATVFTGGRIYSTWEDFDVNGIWPRVVAEYDGQPLPPLPDPVMLPIPGARVSQPFGARPEVYGPTYQGHPGVDLSAPAGVSHMAWHGTPVQATESGEAVVVHHPTGYGNYVYIRGDRCDELLAHLADTIVVNGQRVNPGDIVGHVGYTGNTEPIGVYGTHLHWGKRPQPYAMGNGYRGYVDPLVKGN